MVLLLLSFIGGLLTVLAPCTLPVLPIILGSSVSKKDFRKPVIITLSLALSIVLFTLLLKASTLLIDIPQQFWQIVSGLIIIFFGIVTLFPHLWEVISVKLGLSSKSSNLLHKAANSKFSKEGSFVGDVLVGMALGPVFASCSPTYFFVLANVLPESFFVGLLNLIVYSIGLIIPMMIIALTGQTLIHMVKKNQKENSTFKTFSKILNILLGLVFIVVGVGIMFGYDKKLEQYLVERDILNFTDIEMRLLENVDE